MSALPPEADMGRAPCPCSHHAADARALADAARHIAHAVRARPEQVTVSATPDLDVVQVDVGIAGRLNVSARAATVADAAQLAVSLAWRALDLGAPREDKRERARRKVGRGLPVIDVPAAPELRGIEAKTKVVGTNARDIGEYAAAAAQDPNGRACKVWVEVGEELG